MRRWVAVAVVLTALACAPLALGAASPAVSASATTSIGTTSATLNGTVNPEGSATTYQFAYGLTAALGSYAPVTPGSAGSGTSAVAEHAALTGLVPGTTYYFQLEASNGAGASSTPIQTFKTTGNPPPVATTGTATSVSRYQATLTGTIAPNDQATTYYFQYGLTDTYGLQTAAASVPAGTATVTVSAVLPGLQPGATFHYRLVATHGSTATSYGGDATVETQPWPRFQTPLTFSVTPRRAKRAPFKFAVSGQVGVPSGTPTALACGGHVHLQLMDGARRLAQRTVAVSATCSYAGDLRLARLPHASSRKHGATLRLQVLVSYGGDTYVAPAHARNAVVVAG